MGDRKRTQPRKGKTRPRGDKTKLKLGPRKLCLWLLFLLACYIGLRILYVYLRLGDSVALTAGVSFIILSALIGLKEYGWIKDGVAVRAVCKLIVRHVTSFLIAMVLAVFLLEHHPSALMTGIAYQGFGEQLVTFLTADPYYLGEQRDMKNEEKKDQAHKPPVSNPDDPATPAAPKEAAEDCWDAAAYQAFFHCAPDGTLDADELMIWWGAVLEHQRGEQHVSAYRPEELEIEETNAIHKISAEEAMNQTVSDWLEQCRAHEKLYHRYPSTTFCYYASNDYHNLLQCGLAQGASAEDLLLWYSKAVYYRLEYLSYRDASSCGEIVHWIGMRYKEIADDPERYGKTVSAHARVNADVLLKLAQECGKR